LAGLEGTTLGPYQVISLLGKGGMGQVYRARDPRLGREVAIKVLSAALSQEHGYLERFRREARSIAQLNHPNIVSVYDFGEQGNTTYLVMPLIQGGTLRELLGQRGMLPLNEAVALVEQIGGALQYAHERGLIHRDVKPANILVGPDGRALLSDFGIVRVVQGEDSGATLTHTGAFVGSPEYAAPEMVLGQTIDRRVDIYALGMMLYQLLTGRTAFSANTPVQLLMMQAQVQPPNPRSINPAIPPAVEAVVLRALAKSPDQRYGSVANGGGIAGGGWHAASRGGDRAGDRPGCEQSGDDAHRPTSSDGWCARCDAACAPAHAAARRLGRNAAAWRLECSPA
jgi:serine/threonine-protein kinase